MTDWQAIETAPKDGTDFIGISYFTNGQVSGVYLARWMTAEQIADAECGDPEDFRGGWDSDGDEVSPRYWIPLPALPKEA